MFSSLLLKKAGGNITRSNQLLLRYISDATRDFLKTTVADNKVVVFMKGTPDAPQCGFSRAVVQILRTQGVDEMAAFNVLENESLRSDVKEFSNWPTLPQVYIGGEFIGGYDILLSMFQNGELEKLLVSEGIVSHPPSPPSS